jgi:hypothetical protein
VPDTRFSEIHYDNAGTDANEASEIEGPAGTSLDGWRIVLGDPSWAAGPERHNGRKRGGWDGSVVSDG